MEDVGRADERSELRALVTGPRGFVGAHLCELLVARGMRVTGLELAGPGTGYFDACRLSEQVELVVGSVTDPTCLGALIGAGQFHYVFHLAAQALVGRALQDPVGSLEVNTRGTYLLLEACRQAWAEGTGALRGVVTAGSDRIYGRQEVLPCTEEAPLCALSPYDASKIAADVITRSYATSYGLPATVARCTNIYGPGDANLSRIVPDTVCTALRGRRPQIRSDGTPERDYVYVGDVAGGYLALAEQGREAGVRGEAFNLGSGAAVSVRDLVTEACRACDRPDLDPEVLGTPTGVVDRHYVSVQKAADRLGWRPLTSRAEGLEQTAAWYRQHLADLTVR